QVWRRGGRRRARVDGDAQRAGEGRHVARRVSGRGGNAVGARREGADGDAVGPTRGGAAALGHAIAIDGDRAARLGGAGEGGRGHVGDVVGVGAAAVGRRRQVGGRGRRGGGGVDGHTQGGGSGAGVARDVGRLGGDTVGAVGQGRGQGEA